MERSKYKEIFHSFISVDKSSIRMRSPTNITRLVLFNNGVGKLLVDKDIIVPVFLFLTAVCGLVPEEVMEQWPKHYSSICKKGGGVWTGVKMGEQNQLEFLEETYERTMTSFAFSLSSSSIQSPMDKLSHPSLSSPHTHTNTSTQIQKSNSFILPVLQ